MLKPRQPAPALQLPLVAGGQWSAQDEVTGDLAMIVFYRGSHCPICKKQLHELDERLDELAAAGVGPITAVSGDTAEAARRSVEEWGVRRLPVAYGMSVEQMREWGLFVSRAVKDGEPDEFGEPGVVLLRPDGTVYAALLASMPFARPRLDDLISAVRHIREKDYPARGEA